MRFFAEIMLMWRSPAQAVLRYRILFLILVTAATGLMGYYASKVKLSYEFSRVIPEDNPKYLEYKNFKETFGDDGNLMVLGVQSPNLLKLNNFIAYSKLDSTIKSVRGAEDVLSVPGAINLVRDSASEKLLSKKIFGGTANDSMLAEQRSEFFNLPFYRNRLYNPETSAYLMAIRINSAVLLSKERSAVVKQITDAAADFEKATGIETHVSGLPLIRTQVADRIQKEMKLFLFASLALSVIVLLLFFRSITTTVLSMLVVAFGVVWAVALIYLLGYKITLLTALIPSLVVVIGIPNCIYFINKYHAACAADNGKFGVQKKLDALVEMVSKMGVVTLFCNITAAIGFAVFAFTKSAILKEFGAVAGIAIMVIFFLSFILLPAALSLLPPPKQRELRYLHNKFIEGLLEKVRLIVFQRRAAVIAISSVIAIIAGLGMMRLKTEAFIVDDLPKKDKLYTDLKFFEKNFRGVMPLEIVIDTKKRRGLSGLKALKVYALVDSLSDFIAAQPVAGRPLTVAEGLKFAKQGFYEGDSVNYALPNTFDGAFVADYLRPSKDSGGNNFAKTLRAFIDTASRRTRMSISMADVGTEKLPIFLDKLKKRSDELFDSSYNVSFTGTGITFLEGSRFIINGLKESVLLAFALIAVCMLFLFRSLRILLCSLLPNVLPLLITAGIMGWTGVPLKPSTVLIFSIALGIAIDITIRFLVNYRQVLPQNDHNVAQAVAVTIRQTGLSIIYTALVLTAGFVIFCFSGFGGTFALGWLTSVTLLAATVTNLLLLPVLLLLFQKNKKHPSHV